MSVAHAPRSSVGVAGREEYDRIERARYVDGSVVEPHVAEDERGAAALEETSLETRLRRWIQACDVDAAQTWTTDRLHGEEAASPERQGDDAVVVTERGAHERAHGALRSGLEEVRVRGDVE